jgi:hypothetical protein
MTRNQFLGAIVFAAVCTSSSAIAGVMSRNYDLPNFSRIEAGGSIKFEIVADQPQAVSITAEESVLNNLNVRVIEDTLEIDKKDSTWQWPWQSSEVTLKISVPTLNSIDFSGAAKGQVAKINSKEFEISVSGAAEVELSGKTEELIVDLSGSGKIKAIGLESKRVIADVSGAGDIEVFATQLLDADVSGVGSLSYKGSPAVVKTDVSGVAKVQPKG